MNVNMTNNNADNVNVDVREIMPKKGLTLTATAKFKGTWRIKVAARLIRLASWVLGTEMVLSFPEAKA